MASRIEDYALIGNTHTAALVGRNGSIDWLCLPRFDSPACFAALVGTPDNGHWLLRPAGLIRGVHRHYRENTLVLETEFATDGGVVGVVDFMHRPAEDDRLYVVRLVEGRRGEVQMHMQMAPAFEYGRQRPSVERVPGGVLFGGDARIRLLGGLDMQAGDDAATAHFRVAEGQRQWFMLVWHPAQAEDMAAHPDPWRMLGETDGWWRDWCGQCTYEGEWREAVLRSLVTLKGLTYSPTGGIVAAPTTSLPEHIGGERNWDYRYCWLRDATFTLYALLDSGFGREAEAWRDWLLRVVSTDFADIRIMYGINCQRALDERELPWLAGYEGSRPVRIGNAAYRQLQLDVHGEVMDMLHAARKHHLQPTAEAWRVQKAFLDVLEARWKEADRGIWEVRGPPRQFTHSKVMAWVAMDRVLKDCLAFRLGGPVERWAALRDEMHAHACTHGYDRERGSFVQYFGGKCLDAALLMIPLVGFLPVDDERVAGTIAAVKRELLVDGLVRRYTPDPAVEGLSGGEGAFLACSFWLADCLVLQGREDEARQIFEHLLDLRNDVGLLSEEYDPEARRMLGNFPQAFSHVALIDTAHNLHTAFGPARQRRE